METREMVTVLRAERTCTAKAEQELWVALGRTGFQFTLTGMESQQLKAQWM